MCGGVSSGLNRCHASHLLLIGDRPIRDVAHRFWPWDGGSKGAARRPSRTILGGGGFDFEMG
jgi:hypothetical protein